MTTIAASLPLRMMAADSRVLIQNPKFGTSVAAACTKLIRIRQSIVGCAGNDEDIAAFEAWFKDQRRKRPKCKEDFEALVLTRTELWHYVDNTRPESCRLGFMAIGTGGPVALGSLTTQMLVGHEAIDPRVAVLAACHHDEYTREPIDWLTWKA
jgi:hypothetical protein